MSNNNDGSPITFGGVINGKEKVSKAIELRYRANNSVKPSYVMTTLISLATHSFDDLDSGGVLTDAEKDAVALMNVTEVLEQIQKSVSIVYTYLATVTLTKCTDHSDPEQLAAVLKKLKTFVTTLDNDTAEVTNALDNAVQAFDRGEISELNQESVMSAMKNMDSQALNEVLKIFEDDFKK